MKETSRELRKDLTADQREQAERVGRVLYRSNDTKAMMSHHYRVEKFIPSQKQH